MLFESLWDKIFGHTVILYVLEPSGTESLGTDSRVHKRTKKPLGSYVLEKRRSENESVGRISTSVQYVLENQHDVNVHCMKGNTSE